MVVRSGTKWGRAVSGAKRQDGEFEAVFLGSYEHTMDDKGRVSLPARFREMLSTVGDCRLVLTTNLDTEGKCLVAYPIPQWEAFQDKVAAMPQFDRAVILLKRLHFAGATEVASDRQGRILIPQALREAAGLTGAVLFAGIGDKIEIWDSDAFAQQREQAKENLEQINETLLGLGF